MHIPTDGKTDEGRSEELRHDSMVTATRAAAVLVAALACFAVARASAEWDDDDSSNCGDFDFFVFTRQWPAGNGCSSNCQNAFTIHGACA